MRRPRMKAEGAGYYHGMSRVIERRHILGEKEKEHLLGLMTGLAAFGGLKILTYGLLANHFHILLHVPERREVSDEELLRHLAFILSPAKLDDFTLKLKAHRERGEHAAAEAMRARYTYRMFDLSEFFKALKQRFSQFYNKRAARKGPLWEQRFKSILVEGSEHALLTMAAYIDLNPVRAGLVADPKDYRYSGYGAALGGVAGAREGLQELLHVAVDGSAPSSWEQVQQAYRRHLYGQGEEGGVDEDGRPLRRGFSSEEVQAVRDAGGRLPMQELLRCRVRYFSDGLALGTQAYLERLFARYRGHFGQRRQTGARRMRGGDWGGLCTLRDLRLHPVLRC